MDVVQSEQGNVMNDTFSSRTENDSQLNYSVSEDDSIFNDKTFQDEELTAMKRNRLKVIIIP